MKFNPSQRLEIVATACEPGPAIEGRNGWTLDLIHDAVTSRSIAQISRSQLHVILQRAELQPHRKRMWLHSPDPEFREKVDDIVRLYLNPPQLRGTPSRAESHARTAETASAAGTASLESVSSNTFATAH